MNNEELRDKLYQVGPGCEIDGYELCDCCDGRSPGISMYDESIMHCPGCNDRHIVTTEKAHD
jgi:hypothetical protein